MRKRKLARRHTLFNLAIIIIPWATLLFMGKRDLKRYSVAGVTIVVFEIINHIVGYKKNWWSFYVKRKSFLTNELPFSIGPYMPLSMWLLKLFYGDFKKFMVANVVVDGLFAFWFINVLRKLKIINMKLSNLQFFFYLNYKASILYFVQYLSERKKIYIG
ncbi:hypothetical protein M3182_08175 [Mesobacillus maritimus]|uniref:hypothetical protein n=1 Tax=Mesobacillus maritimus TaxID=1643336 RepID=UPI002041307B|nr:hypothetical protein [Mesobacillus maritimus]MCM3585726.1 hypothetical protein [Mesobacillus maritimus]MCM3670481.1 hypothetical protein [Mesobacillus maritimus]